MSPAPHLPAAIRAGVEHAPIRERAGFTGDHAALTNPVYVAPDDATDDELDTVVVIRAQLHPDFSVEDLRNSRATAISEALTIAAGFDAAGRPDQANTYRVLAIMLEHPRRGRTLPCPHPGAEVPSDA